MKRSAIFAAALLLSTSALGQSVYPPGAIPITASASGTTAAVVATIPALASKTAVICGFYYAGSNATAAQAGSVTVAGTVGGTMSFGYPTLAAGAAVPNAGPVDEAFTPCVPATSVNVAIVVSGPALGAGATVATTTAWGFYQ
jgi:hypothetical protein